VTKGKAAKQAWRNRIVGHDVKPASWFLANEENWRIHPKKQQEATEGVLDEVGWVQDVMVNKRTSPQWADRQGVETLVDGHMRVLLALKVSDDEPVPLEYVDLTPDEERKVLLTLDPLAAMAAADKEKLDGLLREVSSESAAVQAMLAEIAEKEGIRLGRELPAPEAQIDKAAELQEKWQVTTGSVWEAGAQRLICGDCTDRATVDRLMRREKAALVVTSPPYFNQREYSQWKEYADYLSFAERCVKGTSDNLGDDSIFVVNIGSDEPARRWMPSDWWVILRDCGWLYRECIAWVKSAAVWSVPRSMHIENGHYFPAQRWEVMLVVSRGDHPKFDIADRDKVRRFDENVWEIGVVTGGEQRALGHTAPFPLEIPERFTMAYTQKGAIVLDPFCGSGSTLVACARLGRRGRGIEIIPQYVSVALQRLQDMGLEVKRVEDGHSITSPP